ncbi:MAG: hypothetical protein GXP27_08775 [Planctomycetes bacterium]|nr:hypothetical protein [Planctomycetota bacterium]
MKPIRWWTVFGAVSLVLVASRVAYANTLSPYVWFWPGVVSIVLPYTFPASLLAALIERPFLTAGRISEHALLVSLRANLLITLVGLLLIPIGWPALYTLGPLWCGIAFAVSCGVELFYIRRFVGPFSWGMMIAANIVSSVTLMVLPPIALALKQYDPTWAWSLAPYERPLAVWSSIVSVGIFLVSFAWPGHEGKSCAVCQGAQQDDDVPDDGNGRVETAHGRPTQLVKEQPLP